MIRAGLPSFQGRRAPAGLCHAPLRLPVFVVDAFVTQAPFSGNPAAVVPLPARIDERLMPGMARQHNLSETAFFVRDAREPDLFHLRWFTPANEVDLCGDATLASGHVVLRELRLLESPIRFMTRSGELRVAPDRDHLALDLTAHGSRPVDRIDAAAAALGARPSATLDGHWLLAVFDDDDAKRGLDPDMAPFHELHGHGVIAAAPGGAGLDFVSRVFAPRHGVPEDPVTGSAHSALVPYWSSRLGKRSLHARQISARGGDLSCEPLAAEARVVLSGQARSYLRGEAEFAPG